MFSYLNGAYQPNVAFKFVKNRIGQCRFLVRADIRFSVSESRSEKRQLTA
jgi:hypothetical protein